MAHAQLLSKRGGYSVEADDDDDDEARDRL